MCCRLHASYLANVQRKVGQSTCSLFLFVYTPLFVESGLLEVLWWGERNWRRSEGTTNTVFASSQVKNNAGLIFFSRFTFFLRAKSYSAVQYIPSTHHSPTQQTWACIKWIRPGNVSSSVSDRCFLLIPSRETIFNIYKRAPLQIKSPTTLRLSSSLADGHTRGHKLATNVVFCLWKYVQRKTIFKTDTQFSV